MTTDTRKIKQEMSSNWSEYVYSSPNSPQQQQAAVYQNEFNFDHILNHPDSLLNRRHSVAVGEMHFHSFENKTSQPQQNYNELEQLLGASLPSSWSSSNSSHSHDILLPHKRAMSLRLDTQPAMEIHRSSISTASPTTPAFFSPSFLDALKHEENPNFSDDLIHDFILSHPNTTTITPSAMNTGDDTANWFMHNQPLPKRKSSTSSIPSNQSPTNSSIHMISTPSPPSTMLYQHPSIPEEEDEDMDANHVRNNLMLSRIMQGENNMPILKPLIQKYITHQYQDERKIMIFTSKVAQKSYGTEKRFLCPPPTTILSGASWVQPSIDGTNKPLTPNLVIHILGEKTSQNGVLEWKKNETVIDPTTSLVGDTGVTGNCVSKHLHINDADEKRKRVEVLVKITLGNGHLLGTFSSKGIKVISKPSKKRQSLKNIELCIHHGTTVSLFNRIRSQTVSTKYLGVSEDETTGTCFVARTTSWDPFVIWIVDTTRSPDAPQPQLLHHPDNPHFPPPPAIALHPTSEPIALHYNQAVVLQCVTTGLVSPVMIIRKVDKGSMVLGGNRVDDLSGFTGGECGDEALGDPVSQLHKVAFQIVHDPAVAHHNKSNYQPTLPIPTAEWTLPQTQQHATYLACLDNVVGMHKTNNERQFIASRPVPPSSNNPMMMDILSSWSDPFDASYHAGGGKMMNRNNNKRRVSYDSKGGMTHQQPHRRRVNSLNDIRQQQQEGGGRRGSLDRRSSVSSSADHGDSGSCWTEDVSDASIWTIVGTDCASYKFYTPPPTMDLNSPFSSMNTHPITPFPVLSTKVPLHYEAHQKVLHLLGENFTRDVSVWFGDIKSVKTEYKSREAISCHIPDLNELMSSPTCILDKNTEQRKVPLLFVRGDGIVYNTDLFFTF